jgi:hypothetical protein
MPCPERATFASGKPDTQSTSLAPKPYTHPQPFGLPCDCTALAALQLQFHESALHCWACIALANIVVNGLVR